ncbi:dTDP-4-dehydrorhamnose reductase [Paenibacillus xylanilyticus]|uniref:dTDP-4-dehydrorhamnose reductase n=1 Tax=Paenibacillus xylanilyticus TaxID=248903 RepID=UPI0039A0634D
MKVLVTGVKGQLGFDVVKCLYEQGIEFISSNDIDLTNEEETSIFIRDYLPDVVVHCAAYTDVDRAEVEAEKCRKVNVDSTARIASLCNELGSKLVYISTDYVFSGEGTDPYEIYSEVGPKSIYGQTKLAGEKEVIFRLQRYFIIRTSWSFGINGDNFVKTMLRLTEDHEVIKVVSDQVGSPTYTFDLARLIVEMLQTEKYGVYHATNEGFCSWAEFASEIFIQTNKKTRVEFVKSHEYSSRADRPKNSKLSKSSLELSGFNRLPHWKEALARYLIEFNTK